MHLKIVCREFYGEKSFALNVDRMINLKFCESNYSIDELESFLKALNTIRKHAPDLISNIKKNIKKEKAAIEAHCDLEMGIVAYD